MAYDSNNQRTMNRIEVTCNQQNFILFEGMCTASENVII